MVTIEPTTDRPPASPRLRAAGMATAVLAPLFGVGWTWLKAIDPAGTHAYSLGDDLFALNLFLIWWPIGTFLLWRRPDHPVSWCVQLTVTTMAASGFGWEYARRALEVDPLPLVRVAAWFNWGFFGWVAVIGVFLPLLFPTGRPPTPRWRWVLWAAGSGLAAMVIPWTIELIVFDGALSMRLLEENSLTGAAWVTAAGIAGFSLLLVALVAALASVVVRFRRARSVERLQLKWFMLAVAGLVAALLVEFTFQGPVSLVLMLATSSAVPVAIAVAITRYRLFDIDRIVSRTVTYAVVAAVLAAVYAIPVVTIPGVIGGSSSAAVAGATLTVAALFNPVRRRVHRVVERRFDRVRFDAEREVDGFVTRLRDRADLDGVAADLTDVVGRTLQPMSAGVWLKEQA